MTESHTAARHRAGGDHADDHGTRRHDVPLRADAPPLAPAEPAIDRAHLARMTHGETVLEREVLQLFATQVEILLRRMRTVEPAAVGALAHTLCGSACSIGAGRVAEAAMAVEAAAADGLDLAGSVQRLSAAAHEAQRAIADLLRG